MRLAFQSGVKVVYLVFTPFFYHDTTTIATVYMWYCSYTMAKALDPHRHTQTQKHTHNDAASLSYIIH